MIGKVTDNPKKMYRYLKPIADYVAAHMHDLGIREAKVLMAKNNEQMVSYFKQGKIDWLTETTFSAAYFHEKADAEFLLKKWKKGVGEYRTIFFVRKDSNINSLEDLKGKTIAFEDSGSTTAYYLPASLLIEKGLKLVQLASIREKPPADMVGYVFSHQEINTSTWVYRGLVEVGAFNNLDWNKDDHVRKVYRKEMKIIHESRPFPRAIELVNKDLDPKIRARLKEVLLNIHNDPKASAALKAYQRTKKFEEIDEDCRAFLEEASCLLKTVGSELN
ncbi:phosphate/phosphite/phosphonate ABC transporter substrate-binding protein [Desulfoluna sp.]|uniref:phosphate/phosphite/phosphonate ABC transporter substrate-binding protein n=1 Tax=Desulfoluna sp. TaxID=2045199 RepID=UPI002622DFF5|nr:phosphate/phosphite/phosphonate ABC transporter substrate-binding protein [Desulfoluna sp.]